MTTTLEQDSLTRFIFEHQDIRGEIVRLNHSFERIINQHQYPANISKLVAEALLTAVLLTATLKFEGQLTLQFQSDGPIKMLVAKCSHRFKIRALAQIKPELFNETLSNQALLGDGQLVVTVQPDNQKEPYQSIIPLASSNIAQAMELYFAQSEQLATRIWLASTEKEAVGMLLQALPEQNSAERELFWEHAVKLGETITEEELLNLSNKTILHRLYHEEDIRIFDPHAIAFNCACNRTRMANAVKMLGKEDADALLTEKQYIAVTCEFCNQQFNFDKVDVAEIFHI